MIIMKGYEVRTWEIRPVLKEVQGRVESFEEAKKLCKHLIVEKGYELEDIEVEGSEGILKIKI